MGKLKGEREGTVQVYIEKRRERWRRGNRMLRK
jgi:hypothetical protein